MFLGNLSTAQERKARTQAGSSSGSSSSTSTGKSSQDDELDALLSGLKVHDDGEMRETMRRKKRGELPILYSKELFQAKLDREAAAARTAALNLTSSAPSSSSSSSSGSPVTAPAPAVSVSTSPSQFVPRELVLRFFRECSLMMETRANVEEIVDVSWKTSTPLHAAAMEFQKDVMEFNFQIERQFGCQYIAVLNNSDDEDIVEAASDFMFTCLKCYLACLRLRAKKYYKGQRRATGGMARATVMEFFEGCNALMAMPETKATLQREFTEVKKRKGPPNEKVSQAVSWTGTYSRCRVSSNRLRGSCSPSAPTPTPTPQPHSHNHSHPATEPVTPLYDHSPPYRNPLSVVTPPPLQVIELQRGVLNLLGMDAEYGVNRLNRLGQDYRTDQEVMMKMQHFAMAAQVACREACMTVEERSAFYSEIPPSLRHCPFAYVMQVGRGLTVSLPVCLFACFVETPTLNLVLTLPARTHQKNMAMQQQQQLQQQQQRQRGPPGPLPGGLTQQGLMQQQSQMMNDPEKRAKMAAFSAKLPGFKKVGGVSCIKMFRGEVEYIPHLLSTNSTPAPYAFPHSSRAPTFALTSRSAPVGTRAGDRPHEYDGEARLPR